MEKINPGDINRTNERLEAISNMKRLDNPRDLYGILGREDASEYFWHHPKWKEEILKYFRQIHESGGKVVYVDICGQATGENLGADQSYSFSFDAPKNKIKSSDSAVFVTGNIFKMEDVSRFLEVIKAGGTAPALVTFNPISAFDTYKPDINLVRQDSTKREFYIQKAIIYKKFEKVLKEVVDVIGEKSYVLFSPPFRYFEQPPELRAEVKKIAGKLNCEVEADPISTGEDPDFLLRKK